MKISLYHLSKNLFFVLCLMAVNNHLSAQDMVATESDDFLSAELYASNVVSKSTTIESDSTKNTPEIAAATPEKNTETTSKSVLSIARVEGFNAFANDKNIRFNWTTTSERNSKKIILERRAESDRNYEEVDYVMGRGTTYEKANFYLIDYETAAGVQYFYRLKMINNDDEYGYSEVISAKR